MRLTLSDCKSLDEQYAHTAVVRWFAHGQDDALYFDANSIGPMPLTVPDRMAEVLAQGWAHDRRRSWNERDWLQAPRALGAGVAHLLGAAPDDVVVTDTTSVNQYKLLRYALTLRAPRNVVVMERDVFPSNRYVAEGLQAAGLAQVRLIDDVAQLTQSLAPNDVAVVALSHVDYRSSVRLDMGAINGQVHAAGALSLWDLSHAAGAVAVDLRRTQSDLAVSCGYKYLCGGPGAPALMYVHPRWAQSAWPALCGWMGHADTFAFDPNYQPAQGVERFLVGTPAVLANTAFSCAADIWKAVNVHEMDARHRSVSDTLIQLLDERCNELGVEIESPRHHAQRGGHVAIRCTGAEASAVAQALVARGVIVSSRKPDVLRFGVHPLTSSHTDVWQAVDLLTQVLHSGEWRDPRFAGRAV